MIRQDDPPVRITTLLAAITLQVPPEADGARALVFVNCPYLDPATPPSDPHYLGTATFFGLGHHAAAGHAHGGTSATYTFPLDATLGRLPSRPNVSAGNLRFQVITRPTPGRTESPEVLVEKIEIITG